MSGGSQSIPQNRAVCSIETLKLSNAWPCMPSGAKSLVSPPVVGTHRQCLPCNAVPPSPYAHPHDEPRSLQRELLCGHVDGEVRIEIVERAQVKIVCGAQRICQHPVGARAA